MSKPTRLTHSQQRIAAEMLSRVYQLHRLVSNLPEEFKGMGFVELTTSLPEEPRAALIELLDALVNDAELMRQVEQRNHAALEVGW